jgi:hypothetical protein
VFLRPSYREVVTANEVLGRAVLTGRLGFVAFTLKRKRIRICLLRDGGGPEPFVPCIWYILRGFGWKTPSYSHE